MAAMDASREQYIAHLESQLTESQQALEERTRHFDTVQRERDRIAGHLEDLTTALSNIRNEKQEGLEQRLQEALRQNAALCREKDAMSIQIADLIATLSSVRGLRDDLAGILERQDHVRERRVKAEHESLHTILELVAAGVQKHDMDRFLAELKDSIQTASLRGPDESASRKTVEGLLWLMADAIVCTSEAVRSESEERERLAKLARQLKNALRKVNGG